MEKTYVIKNKFSGKIIFSLKCVSLQLCVHTAIAWGISLDGASFKNASFKNASFDYASFNGASFNGASFNGASFDGASFDGASFKNASFKNASFKNASFDYASFNGASFDGASFDGASFDGASFDGASLDYASFVNVKGLVFIQWAGYTMIIQKDKSKIGCEFRSNKEWLEMDIDKAVGLGIDAKHFEFYRSLLRASIEILMN